MQQPKLKEVPAAALEQAIDFNVRNMPGSQPHDYLRRFLGVARQFGYATHDDSWGELEKELGIAFGRLVRAERTLDFIADALGLDDDGRDDLVQLGEEHWRAERDREQRLKSLLERVRRDVT